VIATRHYTNNTLPSPPDKRRTVAGVEVNLGRRQTLKPGRNTSAVAVPQGNSLAGKIHRMA